MGLSLGIGIYKAASLKAAGRSRSETRGTKGAEPEFWLLLGSHGRRAEGLWVPNCQLQAGHPWVPFAPLGTALQGVPGGCKERGEMSTSSSHAPSPGQRRRG